MTPDTTQKMVILDNQAKIGNQLISIVVNEIHKVFCQRKNHHLPPEGFPLEDSRQMKGPEAHQDQEGPGHRPRASISVNRMGRQFIKDLPELWLENHPGHRSGTSINGNRQMFTDITTLKGKCLRRD
jgi:hypothetical protein